MDLGFSRLKGVGTSIVTLAGDRVTYHTSSVMIVILKLKMVDGVAPETSMRLMDTAITSLIRILMLAG